jgi:hypothetical protein
MAGKRCRCVCPKRNQELQKLDKVEIIGYTIIEGEKMSIKKFHRDTGFEQGAIKEIFHGLQRFSQLRYTQHAKLETIKDRYAIIPVVKLHHINPADIFEYTREDGQIVKFAIRIRSFDNNLDFCYSISLDGNVVTAWANDKADSHRTLNEALYERV